MPTFVQQSDTAANTLTVVSGSSTLIAFATAWLPVFSMIAACVAIVSGIVTISTLDVTTGTIDYLSGTNVSYSGIGTIEGTLNVGAAGTVITTSIGGEVGINSTVPTYKLDVGGDINSSTDLKIDGISVLTTASNDALALAIALG